MNNPTIYKLMSNDGTRQDSWAVEFPCGLVAVSLEGPRLGVSVYGNLADAEYMTQREHRMSFVKLASDAPEKKEAPEPTYRIGDVFKQTSFHDDGGYILAQVNDGQCCLISLKDGNRFTSPTAVQDVYKITARELRKMWGRTGEFRIVKKV